MTNTEVRIALDTLLAEIPATVGSKILNFAGSYTRLRDRIIVAPNAHINEPGEDEANPQFVADLERLQGIASELAQASIPEI